MPVLARLGKTSLKLKKEQLRSLQREETEVLKQMIQRSRLLDSSNSSWIASSSQAAYNDFVEEKAQNLLDMFGKFLLDALKDPDAPAPVHRAIDRGWGRLWPDIEKEMRWGILDALQLVDNETNLFRELRMRRWAPSRPLFPRGIMSFSPIMWLRARILHSLYPAESKGPLNDFAFVVWQVLNITTVFEVCNIVTILHFVMIDKSDEVSFPHPFRT